MHNVEIGTDIVERVLARRGRLHLYDSLDPEKTAFVIIDMQNLFCKPAAPTEVPASRDVVDNINRLNRELRPLGAHIIWIYSAVVMSYARAIGTTSSIFPPLRQRPTHPLATTGRWLGWTHQITRTIREITQNWYHRSRKKTY